VNAINLAKTAYSNPAITTRTLRGVEYDLFARITARLSRAAALGKAGFPDLATAIYENRRLWITLALDVADPDNALPASLRARLFYLAQFTEQHSGKVLAGMASSEVLVDINTAIMRGLRGIGEIA